MWKSLLILGVIVVVIVGAVGLVLSNLNSYLTSNKDWLAAQVEGVLGRKVAFSEIGVSLSSGFGVRVKDVRIADDPVFSQDDFVRAGAVEVSVKIWPALFCRFEVKRLVLEQPDVTILRTRDGMNYDSIGKTTNAEAPPASEAPQAPPGVAAPTKAEPATLVVALVVIKGGRGQMVCKTTSPPAPEPADRRRRQRSRPCRTGRQHDLAGAAKRRRLAGRRRPAERSARRHRWSRRDKAGYAADPGRRVAEGQSVGH
jgi:hypothetical protein